jgi:probable HAF family extracellular repeat protein
LEHHAFIWRNGVMTDLGTLGGSFSQANDINAAGDIAGASNDANEHAHAVVWRNGVIIDLGTLGGTHGLGVGINAAGDVVGSSYTTGDSNVRPFLWRNGVMIDLGALDWELPFPPSAEAWAISPGGYAVGSSTGPGNTIRAVLWETR